MKKKKTEFHEPKREENAEVKHEDDDVSVEILRPDFDTRPDSLPKSGKQSKVKHEDDDVSVEILPRDFGIHPDSLPKPGKQSRSSKLSVKSSFRVEIRETHFKYRRLHIPREFSRRHLMHKKQTLKLQVADYSKKQKKKQEWVVKTCKWEGQERDDLLLQFGIFNFLRDNSIRVGHVCEFEMIGVVDSFRVLQVSIFRKKAQ